MRLILFPLTILFGVTIFGFLIAQGVPSGFGSGVLTYNGDDPNVAGDDSGWYVRISGSPVYRYETGGKPVWVSKGDFVGEHVMYGNGTLVNPANNGTIHNIQTGGSPGAWNNFMVWDNRTWSSVGYGSLPTVVSGGEYTVFNKNGEAVLFDPQAAVLAQPWWFMGSLGLLGVVGGVIAVACVAGFKLFWMFFCLLVW